MLTYSWLIYRAPTFASYQFVPEMYVLKILVSYFILLYAHIIVSVCLWFLLMIFFMLLVIVAKIFVNTMKIFGNIPIKKF